LHPAPSSEVTKCLKWAVSRCRGVHSIHLTGAAIVVDGTFVLADIVTVRRMRSVDVERDRAFVSLDDRILVDSEVVVRRDGALDAREAVLPGRDRG